jgi:hypothetical protein
VIDCKETLGALRPGNKVLIRIIAINSSGAKVGVLGPAEFLTAVRSLELRFFVMLICLSL